MTSKREEILTALMRKIVSLETPDIKVFRNLDAPQKIPTGGIIIVRDNEAAKETEVFLNPLTYVYELVITVEIMVQHQDCEKRVYMLDDLLVKVGKLISANSSLNNLVEWMEAKPAEFTEESIEGAATVRSADVPVVIRFSSFQAD